MSNELYSGEKIGAFLLRINAISSEELKIVLEFQKKHPELLFGEIAVKKGFINDSAIDEYLSAKFDN